MHKNNSILAMSHADMGCISTFQPVSVLTEYCQKTGMQPVFQEVTVVRSSMFGCQCSIDGKQYQFGVGINKREAKIDAAKKAFTSIMGETYSDPGE